MSRDYAAEARHFLSKEAKVKFESSDSIDKLIIKRATEEQVAGDMESLHDTISASLNAFVQKKLKPRLEFEHVREAGFRIWGGRDNMAVSKYTMSRILHEIASVCPADSLRIALINAGSRSAVQFFQDFLPLLYPESQLTVPVNELDFLKTLASFDLRSSWWTKEPRFETGDSQLSITLNQPFTSFPWSEHDSQVFNGFLCEYFQTLFNSAADFLRAANRAIGRSHRGLFCVHVIDLDDMPTDRLCLQLYNTKVYVEEYDGLDEVFFAAYSDLLRRQSDQEPDLAEFEDYYRDIVSRLRNAFGEATEFEEEIWKEINRRKDKPSRHLDQTPSGILMDLRLKYDVLRRKQLLELDIPLQNFINRPIDDVT